MRRMTAWRGGQCLIASVWLAETAPERMQGLLGRPQLGSDEAMLITPCRMVHTFGMQYPLDLAFVDRKGRVRKLVSAVVPKRMAGCLRALSTLELAAGSIAALGLRVGDELDWRPACG